MVKKYKYNKITFVVKIILRMQFRLTGLCYWNKNMFVVAR